MSSEGASEQQGLLPSSAAADGVNDASLETTIEELSNRVLGEKSIGRIGSFAFLVNQVYGPGMLVLPVAILQGGFVCVSVFNVVVYLLSVVGALMVVEAIAKIEGNGNFEHRVEFSTMVLTYVQQPWANLLRVCFHLTMVLLNICSIVMTAQAMDNMIVWVFGNTYAIQVYPEAKIETFFASGQDAIDGLYSGKLYRIGITLGYVIISVVTMPLGFLTLSGSIWLQIASFFFLMGTMIVFLYNFASAWAANGDEVRSHHVEAFDDGNYALSVTATVVSYMYSMYMPTWINEKLPHVPIRSSMWTITTVIMVIYIVFGVCAAVSYPYLKERNVMQYLYESKNTSDFMRCIILIFTFTTVLPGIPINAISVRYNLYVSGLCGEYTSYFWGACSPFLVAWIFSNRELSVGVVLWTVLLCGGLVNLVLPPYLYYMARSAEQAGRPIKLVKDRHDSPWAECYECGGARSEAHKQESIFDEEADPLVAKDGAIAVVKRRDEEEMAKEEQEPATAAGEVYIFEGEHFKVFREHHGKVASTMVACFVLLVSFGVYWRLRFEGNVDLADTGENALIDSI